MAINKVILVGNVGRDPETRYLDENTAVCNFTMATSETYKNRNGERVTTTEWHNIVLWRGLAKVAEQYVRKGSQLYIEGKIRTRSYDDANGVKKYVTEIVADEMKLLGRRPEGDEAGQGTAYQGGQNLNQGTGQPAQSTQTTQAEQPTKAAQPAQTPQPQQPAQAQTAAQPAEPHSSQASPGSDESDPLGQASDEADDLPF